MQFLKTFHLETFYPQMALFRLIYWNVSGTFSDMASKKSINTCNDSFLYILKKIARKLFKEFIGNSENICYSRKNLENQNAKISAKRCVITDLRFSWANPYGNFGEIYIKVEKYFNLLLIFRFSSGFCGIINMLLCSC